MRAQSKYNRVGKSSFGLKEDAMGRRANVQGESSSSLDPKFLDRESSLQLRWRNDQLQSLATRLRSYGLSNTQARLYLFLLASGPQPARIVSKGINLHRVDTYRRLRELTDLGLAEIHFGSPARYAALDTDTALDALMGRMETKLSILKEDLKELKQEMREFHRTNELARLVEFPETAETARLVVGRERYYNEIRQLVRDSNTEILRILTGNGLTRTLMSGLYKDYVRAKAKGVKIRMISEINESNNDVAKRLSRILELRHLEGVHLRFVVIDRLIAVLSARFDDRSMSMNTTADSYLIFKDRNFASVAAFIFEHLWNSAIPYAELSTSK